MIGKRHRSLLLAALIVCGGYSTAAAQEPGGASPEVVANSEEILMRAKGQLRDGADAKELEEGLALLTSAAENGSSEAQFLLAEIYKDGRYGAHQNVASSVLYYDMAAAQGDVIANIRLGDLYRSGKADLLPDLLKASEAFARAAEAGNPYAMLSLGNMYLKGEGVDQNIGEAIRLFKLAADSGEARAAAQLGDVYINKTYGVYSPEDGIRFYESAADGGSVSAVRKLGDIYRRGEGSISPDTAKAEAYYTEAMSLGDPSAARSMASMLLTERPSPEHIERALGLLKDAAESGDSSAAAQLSSIYSQGIVVPADFDAAKSSAVLASRLGNSSAMTNFAVQIVRGPLSSKYARAGLDLLRQGVAESWPDAPAQLARLAIEGKVPNMGPSQAIETLKSAAAANDSSAIRYLIAIYRDGIKGQRKRPEEARQLLEQHADLLGADTAGVESVYLLASTHAPMESIYEEFKKLPRNRAIPVYQRLRYANPNAFVYIAQRELAKADRFSGTPNGTLNTATVSAMMEFCYEFGEQSACARGPLSSSFATEVASSLLSIGS